MSLTQTAKGDMPYQVRSLVRTPLSPPTIPLPPPQQQQRSPQRVHIATAPSVHQDDDAQAHMLTGSRSTESHADVTAAVPVATEIRRTIRLLQLPRIRKTENARRLSGAQERVGGEAGTGAYAERPEGAADIEGAWAIPCGGGWCCQCLRRSLYSMSADAWT